MLVSANQRSKIDLSAKSIGTLDFGRLQPIYIQEVIPGDDITVNVGAFNRAAPLAAPVMARMRQDIDVFFVPTRILWRNWFKYSQGLINDTPPYKLIIDLMVQLQRKGTVQERDNRAVASGLKFPVDCAVSNSFPVSILPWRAYQRIWFDWYRDPQLISDAVEDSYCPSSSGQQSGLDFLSARYRCFKKDYLTALQHSPNGGEGSPSLVQSYGVTVNALNDFAPSSLAGSSITDLNDPHNVDTSNSSTNLTPVQYIRAANALQRWFELNNIVGNRIIDRLRARYGVAPTDVRLDRAEFLGRTTTAFNIGDVVSTSQTGSKQVNSPFGTASSYLSEGTMQGQTTGKAIAFDDPSGNTFSYHAQEDGFLIVLASIIPDTSYFGGVDRMFLRGLSTIGANRFDWFTPELANIGMEPVPVQEAVLPVKSSIYPEGSSERTFMNAFIGNFEVVRKLPIGFMNRYNDYRFTRDVLFGDMADMSFHQENQCYNLFRYLCDEYTKGGEYSLDQLIEFFTSLSFRTCDVLSRSIFDRVFAVSNPLFDHFNFEADIHAKFTRNIPQYGMPDLGDDAVHDKSRRVPNGGSRL